ncbi:BPSS1780 family membrane protein [Photorhabdus caribbeanensis]|uniref:BPSS1780 family membrane protein n=1 Tax=Photorhabdus caribbeanensis TaxID=1004165 RepID=UPI001FE92BD9|nr:BPSS1780 family membrane protein [Photorhabdus caribbeanensis]
MDNQNLNFNSNAMTNDHQEVFIPNGQSLSSTEGVKWIGQAWQLVKNKWGMWILLYIIYSICMASFMLIPFIGIFTLFLNPVFIGGIIAVCEKQRTSGEFELGLLFNGFQKNFASLLGVGALTLGIILLGVIVMFIAGGSAVIHILLALASQHSEISAEMLLNSLSSLLLGLFILMVFSIVNAALTWFAPALIVIHNLKFGAAISMSLAAVKKNLLPGLLFFITSALICIISVMTFGLGFLISIPVLLVSYYSSYRSIFISKEKSSTF